MSEKLNVLGWPLTTPQAISAIGVGTYLCGFIAINAHLSKYGVLVFDLADSRYFIVGVLFLAFLLFWYFLAGRAIISLMKRIDEQIENATKLNLGATWYVAIFVNQWTNVLFLTCLSAALFSIMLLVNSIPITFYIYLSVLFLIEYPLSVLGFDFRFPRTKHIYEFVTRTAAIIVFFKTIPLSSPTMIVFVHYLLILSCVNLVLDSFEKFRFTGERFLNAIIYFTVFTILTSAPFGWFHYGNIKSDFGGGQLQAVKIIVVDQTVSNGLKSMGFEATPSLEANLIHQSQRELIVDVDGKIIRLARTAIGAMEVLPTKEVGFIDRLIQMSNKGIWNYQESEQLE